MSIVDPGGGSIISGGVIDVTLGGSQSAFVTGVGNTRIVYNGITITLTKVPFEFQVDPFIPRVVNTTITGVVETLRLPRIDIRVTCKFRPVGNLAGMYALENFWQWAQQGNTFFIAFNDTQIKQTITSASAAFGTNTITVVDASSITNGAYMVLRGGPNYQIIHINNINGLVLTFDNSLNFNFPSGSVLRDILCWSGQIRHEDQHTPIQTRLDYRADVVGQIPNSWEFDFEFFESLVWGA